MLLVLAAVAFAQVLAPSIATVHLVARLAPHAEIKAIASPTAIITRQPTNDTIVLEARPGEPSTVTLDFLTNTRALQIKASAAGSGATIDVAPVTSTCDWVHSEIVV